MEVPVHEIDPVTRAEPRKPAARPKSTARGFLRELVEVALWAVPFFLFFSTFVFQNFKIPTQSMENTLLIGDHLTVNTFVFNHTVSRLERLLVPIREPRRGDVIVFKYPGNPRQRWVKRLVGLPGDQLDILNDYVHLNGERLDEPYAYYKTLDARIASSRDPESRFLPTDYTTLSPGVDQGMGHQNRYISTRDVIHTTRQQLFSLFHATDPDLLERLLLRLESGDGKSVPTGFYYVMGDNRNYSDDSRTWGLLPRELVEGRAYWVWWSYGEDLNTHLDTGLAFAFNYLRYPYTFWTRTHWDKCFKRIK